MGSDFTPVQGIIVCRIIPLILPILFLTGTILNTPYFMGIIPYTSTLPHPLISLLTHSVFNRQQFPPNCSDRDKQHIIP